LGGYHLEIGEASVVAERTGCTVVSDFRTRDIAAGGEGAPLSPFSDWLLFRDPIKGRAIQNVGGIGNVTGLRPAAKRGEVIAFDTGPGNVVIDAVMRTGTRGRMAFDENGQVAARGVVDQTLLGELMGFSYFRTPPPKSTGRELFGDSFTRRLVARANDLGLSFEDTVATATALTAHSIADQYRRFLLPRFQIDEVVVGGGGCHNSTLMGFLRKTLDPVPVRVHEDFGINGDAREALYWGIMANETVHGRPSNMPSVTGARDYVVLGKVLAGRNG
jgi:anhydro-N-acetylmuramic acid kinase